MSQEFSHFEDSDEQSDHDGTEGDDEDEEDYDENSVDISDDDEDREEKSKNEMFFLDSQNKIEKMGGSTSKMNKMQTVEVIKSPENNADLGRSRVSSPPEGGKRPDDL